MSTESKVLAKKVQSALKELGHEISLGHAYELISKIAGYKSWNVASQDSHFTTKVQETFGNSVQLKTPQETGKRCFKVFLNAESLVEKGYYIQAKDEKEAREIMQQYVDYQSGELANHDDPNESLKEGVVLHDQVKKLIEQESSSDFTYQNWVPWDGSSYPKVAEVYNA
jgi:hypothetical protein